MSNGIYRVPLDFDWPIGEMWEGFINPHHQHFAVCPECAGNGISREARALCDIWYGRTKPVEHDGVIDFGEIDCEFGLKYHFTRQPHDPTVSLGRPRINRCWMYLLDQDDIDALVAHQALIQFTHTWNGTAWVAQANVANLSPASINLFAYDNGTHDFLNAWIAIEAVCQRANLTYRCPHCHGTGGTYPNAATLTAALTWKPSGPPEGEGYQLWVPGNEGAPLSRVFTTPVALVDCLLEKARFAGRHLKYHDCMEYVQSEGVRGLSKTELLWLYRDYKMKLEHVFHPALLQVDPYSSS